MPTNEHVLRCRDRTTGVTHELLLLHQRGFAADFDVYDVGGQRSERRHWVRIFQNVKTVLFVVAISEVCVCDKCVSFLMAFVRV